MSTLYLIRHGAVYPSGEEKHCLGRLDLPLTELGRQQALSLRPFFTQKELALFSSPLQRCRETAQLAFGRAAQVEADLIETDVGALDGLAFREIREKWPEVWEQNGADPLHFHPPGGEPFEAAQTRFHAAIRRICAHAEGDAAVVAHAGVMRLFLCTVLGWASPEMYRIRQPYGCVNVLHFQGDGPFEVERMGWLPGV